MNSILKIAHQILALDSIYNVLPWTDRIRLHLAINERLELEPTPAIVAAYDYVVRTQWVSPETRHLKDNDGLFVWLKDRYVPVEEYRELKPIKTN